MAKPLLDDDATQLNPAKSVPRSRSRLALWLLIMILLAAVMTLVVIIVDQPQLVGLTRIVDLQMTGAAVEATAAALNSTSAAHTARDLDLQRTQAALENFEAGLLQTETQAALQRNSTGTAIAFANAQEATQAAVDFSSTQAALVEVSTRIQQEFEVTQTAINQSFATIAADRPPQNVVLLEGNFVRGSETSQSIPVLTSPAWSISDTGVLIAQTDNAIAITRPQTLGANYGLNVQFTASVSASYYVTFGMEEDGSGTILRLNYDGAFMTAAALYTISYDDAVRSTDLGMVLNTSTPLILATNLALAGSEYTLQIDVTGSQTTTLLNGTSIFSTQLPTQPTRGIFGVRLPADTQLLALQFQPR